LSHRNVADVTFVNVSDQPIGIERRNFEEEFSSFHWGAKHLAKIARNNNSIEGGENPSTREFFFRKSELRFGLANLGI
jgi:hypothetical protein